MREALRNLKDGKFKLLWPNKNNCQDWADRLRDEYDRLKEEKEKQNKTKSESE